MLQKLIWLVGTLLWFVTALVVNALLYTLVVLLLVLLTVSKQSHKRRAVWNALRGKQTGVRAGYNHPLRHNNVYFPRASTGVRFKMQPRRLDVIPTPEVTNPYYKVQAS